MDNQIVKEQVTKKENSNNELEIEQVKLKVQAYDLIAEIQYKQNILSQINNRIGEIEQEKHDQPL